MMYVVTTHAGETVLAEHDLARALAVLAELHDTDEDAAVWYGPHVVCVRHPDGRLTWLRPRAGAAAALAA